MAQGNNYGQTSNGVADESPNMLVYRKMEDVIARMQDEKNGIPIRTVKSFLSKIPSVFSGSDIVQWLIKNLTIEDPVEALHLGTLMAAHGYFFPISDHVLTLKDDGTFYRFQTPYFWPSNCWELEASKEPSQQRVKRWGFGMDEALKDPVGREQFLKFLESEFSSENLRFWLAVEDLKRRPIREVPSRVQEIWQEFLAPGAPSAINLDSKSYDKTTQNVKEPELCLHKE